MVDILPRPPGSSNGELYLETAEAGMMFAKLVITYKEAMSDKRENSYTIYFLVWCNISLYFA